MTNIRSKITGEYDLAKLAALKFPIAWSGTVDQVTRSAEESAIADLVAEAMEAIRTDPEADRVSIVDGEVVSTIHYADR